MQVGVAERSPLRFSHVLRVLVVWPARELYVQERQVLALQLSYPEKLWKLANHYYHTNKAWIPAKNLEKLKVFANQQKERERFVKKVLL